MFCSRTTNNRINQLRERALRLAYNLEYYCEYDLSFDELLEKDGSFFARHYNIQALAIEMSKVSNNLSETIFRDLLFREKNTYNFRRNREFQLPRVNTVWNGPNSYRCFRAIIWDLLPSVLECTSSLEKFKIGVRKWKPKRCTCRICKTFIPNIGFSNIY